MQPREQGPTILATNSPSYKAHAKEIQAFRTQARDLGLLRGKFGVEIIGATGIVCSREPNDRRASVSSCFFSLALNSQTLGKPKGDPKSNAVRDLLRKVLAVRLSISEDPQETSGRTDLPVDAYRTSIQDFEIFLAEQELPSLLPNCFQASSLFTQLQKEPWNKPDTPGVRETYERLLSFMLFSDRHLHAIVTAMQRNRMQDDALHAIQKIAKDRCEALPQMCASNPALLQTYAQLLFESRQYAEVIEMCTGTPESVFVAFPSVLEVYLRAHIELKQYEAAERLLDATAGITRTHLNLRKAIGIACYRIGEQMYMAGRHSDAVAFLDRHVPEEVGPEGRPEMMALYFEHQQKLP